MNFLFFLLVRFSPSSHSQVHTAVSGPGGGVTGVGVGGFFLQSPDERAAWSSPAGRSVKAIALAVHCPANEISKKQKIKNTIKKRAEREKGGVEVGKKNGGVSGRVAIWKQRLKDGRRKTGYG